MSWRLLLRLLHILALSAVIALAIVATLAIITQGLLAMVPSPAWDCPDGSDRYLRIDFGDSPGYHCFAREDEKYPRLP